MNGTLFKFRGFYLLNCSINSIHDCSSLAIVTIVLAFLPFVCQGMQLCPMVIPQEVGKLEYILNCLDIIDHN